jgi:hypothetical protein
MTAGGQSGSIRIAIGKSSAARRRRHAGTATRWVRWLAQHQILCLILFFSFVARLFLANWKSYWYDELLSVAIYGSNHATLASAMKSLATHRRTRLSTTPSCTT